MKRIFSLLAALMCLSVSSVWAQNASTTTTTRKVQRISSDATLAAELESGYYLVKFQCKPLYSQTNKSAYVFYKGNDVDGATGSVLCANDVSSVDTDTISSSGSLAYVWYVSKLTDNSGNNILTIQCAGNGGFFPKQNGQGGMMNQSKNFANVGTLCYSDVATNTDNSMSGVLLYQSNCSNNSGVPYYVHANNADAPYELNYWEGGSAGGTACLFSFYKVTLADDVETQATPIFYAKYKQQIDGVDVGVEAFNDKILMRAGSTAVNPWTIDTELYGNATCNPTTVSSTADVVAVNFTTLKLNDYFEPGKYYKLKVRNGNHVPIASTNGSTYVYDYQTDDPNNFAAYYAPESYWCFEKSGVGFKMRNLNGKYVQATIPNSDGTSTATLGEDGTVFYVKPKPSNSSASTGFALAVSNEAALGDHGGVGRLGVWRNSEHTFTDGGSCFTIAKAYDETTLFNEAKAALEKRLTTLTQPTTLQDNIYRVATPETVEKAKTVLASATTIQQVLDAYNTAYAVKPNTSAYYRIRNLNCSTKVYASSENIVVGADGSLKTAYHANTGIDRKIIRKKSSDQLVPQLWQFEDCGNGEYHIKNANNGCYWADTFGNNSDNEDEVVDMPVNGFLGGNYKLVVFPAQSQEHSGNGMSAANNGVSSILLYINGYPLNAFGGDGKDYIKTYPKDVTANDFGFFWQLEEVTSFPVTITNAQYATVGYPFAVKVTSDNVKVYYAIKAEGGILRLTEAKDRIIPANEGAILYSESGATTATVEITNELGSFTGNKLTATTAKRNGFTSLSTYGLSKVNDVVCFRKNESTDVPANKAYLDANNYTSASGSAQQLLFSFDNVVEGIDNVVKAQNANKVYYDLQGRRVLYPAHGIFVTENGEKVFIK